MAKNLSQVANFEAKKASLVALKRQWRPAMPVYADRARPPFGQFRSLASLVWSSTQTAALRRMESGRRWRIENARSPRS